MHLPSLRRASARRSPTRARAQDQPRDAQRVVLAVILASYLMIVLDVSVVITALPDIHTALGFSQAGLSWVQNAYNLTFGGLLLLGARAGDLLGRRRVFVIGIGIFSAASLAAGLAQSATWLLTARAVQGVGAAVAAPSTLALLTTTFREGAERTRALAAYSAVASGGGSAGLVLGGMLTAWASWRWGLFINVPLGLALMYLAPRHLPETEPRHGAFDLTGAVTSTLGMSAIVFGFVHAASAGWGDAATIAAFGGGAVLLLAFVRTERRASQPITPLRLFRSRERSGAYVARILVVGGMFSMFFFLTQYLQGVRGYNPLHAGVAFLPMTLVMFSTARIVPRLVARVGPLRLLVGGLSLAIVGAAWISRLGVTTAYLPGIAIPLVLCGMGMGVTLAPLTGFGVAGVADVDAGAASGVVNAAHQLGGALGLGILVSISSGAQTGSGAPALAHGVAAALTGSAVFLALAIAVVTLVMRGPLELPQFARRALGASVVE